jgi:hypothetical protein
MTTGSGSGWPDVLKVPDQTTEHDPLCPVVGPIVTGCICADLRQRDAKVRADERQSFAHGLDDLRARVAVLPHSRWVGTAWVLRDDVLNLIDGTDQ